MLVNDFKNKVVLSKTTNTKNNDVFLKNFQLKYLTVFIIIAFIAALFA